MALQPWKKVAERVLFENPWWTYKRDEVTLPAGTPGEYHYVHTAGSAMVIPRLADGRFLMVKQYRYLAMRESIEFPCGAVKNGSTHEATARLELLEESGYTAASLQPVAGFNPYNGVTDEWCRVYLADQLAYVGSSPDETEEFELLSLTASEIDELIRSGTLWDGMSMAAWGVVRAKGIVQP